LESASSLGKQQWPYYFTERKFMSWICPTFQRPERLAELAASWERCEPGKELHVRIWDKDPRRADYFACDWPEGWKLYRSSAKGAGEALNEFYRLHPNEDSYGFIGDDIVLRTPGGLAILEETAKPWFVAYPDDVLQRHRIPTHFCMGGRLASTLTYIVPPMFKHNYMDAGLQNVVAPLNLLRYCPQVIFQHKHFLVKEYGIEKDDTYGIVYPTDETTPHGPNEDEGKAALKMFEGAFHQRQVQRLYEALAKEYELWHEWEEEDVVVHCSTG